MRSPRREWPCRERAGPVSAACGSSSGSALLLQLLERGGALAVTQPGAQGEAAEDDQRHSIGRPHEAGIAAHCQMSADIADHRPLIAPPDAPALCAPVA